MRGFTKPLDTAEQVGNKEIRTKNERRDSKGNTAMLSAAITFMFTLAAVLAIAVIVHSLREARIAWDRLMREGEGLRAGIAAQASCAREIRLRPALPPRAFVTQRQASFQPLPLRACCAA
jgi:hypothetical protein